MIEKEIIQQNLAIASFFQQKRWVFLFAFLLCIGQLVKAQGPIPQFWQLNTSPGTLTWDNTSWNNQVDNGSGTFTATSITWSGNGGNTNSKIIAGKDIVFGGNPGVNPAGTVTLNAPLSNIKSITFNPVLSGNFTITGSSIQTNLTNLPISVAASFSPSISSPFTGSGSINKIGLGKLILSGFTTSYSGHFTVSDGTLEFHPDGSQSQNTFTTGSFTNNANVSFVGYGGTTVASYGSVFLASGGGSMVDGNGTWTIDAPKSPPSIWSNRLVLFNCYATGTATVSNYGNLWLQSTAKSTLSVNLNGTNTYLRMYGAAGIVLEIGTITGTGRVDFGDGGAGKDLTLSIGNDNGSGVFSGIISNSGVASGPTTLALVKAGTGIQTLSGNNTYKGGTNINGGTLIVDNGAALGTAAVTINNGGTLTLNADITNAITVNAGGILNKNSHSTGTVTGSGTVNP